MSRIIAYQKKRDYDYRMIDDIDFEKIERVEQALTYVREAYARALSNEDKLKIYKIIIGEVEAPVLTPFQVYDLCRYAARISKPSKYKQLGTHRFVTIGWDGKAKIGKLCNWVKYIFFPDHGFQLHSGEEVYEDTGEHPGWHWQGVIPTKTDLTLMKLGLTSDMLRYLNSYD